MVDHLIDAVITAESREDLVSATRALDRVLLHGHYVIPHNHSPLTRIAYWDKFDRPAIDPLYGLDLQAWWVDPVKADRVTRRQSDLDLDVDLDEAVTE